MHDVAACTAVVLESIARAAERAKREPSSITLVAVSKRQPIELMQNYLSAAEQRGVPAVFGESYVQELKAKRAEFGSSVRFHLIGPLQSNKVRDAVKCADVIESVHSMSIIEAVAKEARTIGKRQEILLQVNIGKDPRKSGFSIEQVPEACLAVTAHKEQLSLGGLMTITPLYEDPAGVRADFAALHQLRQHLKTSTVATCFDRHDIKLSMGMSADFEIAIEEGADFVRVGSAIFGER